MRAELELTPAISLCIETRGLGWCFARIGRSELLVNGTEVVLSTPRRDYWLFLDSKPVKIISAFLGITAFVGTTALLC